jgi:hypothetical protein
VDIVSISPLRVASLFWRTGRETWQMTAICRGTYSLTHGDPVLLPEQEEPEASDVVVRGFPGADVHCPSDMVPRKAKVDVLLVGAAHAREGAVDARTVRLFVGDRMHSVDKTVDVPPESGGHLGAIGFGPLGPMSPPRARRLSEAGLIRPPASCEGYLFPPNFDFAYFNTAPEDQQLDRLRGDEQIMLEGAHPLLKQLVTRLPDHEAIAFLDVPDATPLKVPMECDTLWIDAYRSIFTLTWRGQVPKAHPQRAGRVVVAAGKAGYPMTWEEVLALAGQRSGPGGEASPSPPIPAPASRRASEPGMRDTVALAHHVMASLKVAPGSSATGHVHTATTGDGPRSTQPGESGTPEPASSRGAASSIDQHSMRRGGWSALDSATVTATQASSPPSPPSAPQSFASAARNPAMVTMGPATVMDTLPSWVAVPGPGIADAPPPSAKRPISAALPAAPLLPWAHAPLPNVPPPDVVAPFTPTSPAAVIGHTPEAALLGVAAASTAAAGPGHSVALLVEAPRAAAPAAEQKTYGGRGKEIIELLWFDPKVPARVRARWPDAVAELAFEPLDPRHDLPSDNPDNSRDRHDVFGFLAEGAAIDVGAVGQAVRQAVCERGRFTPPMALVHGEIRFPLDELETMKAVIALVSPTAAHDKPLKAVVGAATELLGTPYLQSATGVVEKLTRELKEHATRADAQAHRHIDMYVERVLLEQRKYQVRKVFGAEHIRALIAPPKSREGVMPVYLPKELESALPMLPSMRARLVAEAHFKQDQYEASDYALRVGALGRVLQPPEPRGSG